MNRNVAIAFAAMCGLSMASCGESSDLRPEEKVSVDLVEPGTRDTYNVGKVNAIYDDNDKEQVMPDRDLGGNSIQKADSLSEKSESNTAEGADKN